VAFDAGWHAYTGSALGPGGFARVGRHRELAAGERETRHWHVDYLLGDSPAEIATVVRAVEADIECAVARTLAERLDADSPVAGFGSSDCDCPAHLQFASERESLVRTVRTAHDEHTPGE